MKKKLKLRRLLPALLAAAMLFSLAACGTGSETTSAAASGSASAGAAKGTFKKGTST